MHVVTFALMSLALASGAARGSGTIGSGAAPDGGSIVSRAQATFSDGTSSDRLFTVTLDRDSDGDGVGDTAYLRVRCDSSVATAVYVHEVRSPRDAASGLATGKRMHKPFTITMELGRTKGSSWTGRASWDLKAATGARMAGGGISAMDDWTQVTMRDGSTSLCA